MAFRCSDYIQSFTTEFNMAVMGFLSQCWPGDKNAAVWLAGFLLQIAEGVLRFAVNAVAAMLFGAVERHIGGGHEFLES